MARFATPRTRFLLLLAIMVTLALAVGGVSLWSMYATSVENEGVRLAALAKSQARLIETFHRWEMKEDHPQDDPVDRLVRFLTASHEGWYEGLGKSGEIVFAQRRGEEIVYLYRQRHGDSQLPRPVPWGKQEVAQPMRLALNGASGVLIGPDYRGVEVHAAYEAIPGLRMGLVVKVDMTESRAPMYRAIEHAILASVAMILLGAMLFTRIGEGVIRRIQQTEENLAITLDAIGDGVIVTDGQGRVIRMNPVAVELTGWSVDQARGEPLAEVFKILNFHTRQPVPNPAALVIESGTVVGLANHTVLIARDGRERHIADSGSPVRDAQNRLIGVVLVFRDVTDEYRMLNALRKGEERLRRLLELRQEAHQLDEKQLCDRAVAMAVELTDSQLGYLHLINEDQQTVTLMTWNQQALQHCTAPHETHYPLTRAGIWADSIRRKEPVVHNDFLAEADRKGYPKGHVPILRHLSVPILEGDQVGLVIGVGNKTAPYDQGDVQQLQLIAEGVQKILSRHRAMEHLRQNRLSLDEAQRIAHLGSWSWRLTGSDWELSPELCRILELPATRDRLDLDGFVACLEPDDQERFRHFIRQIRERQGSGAEEFRVCRQSGQEVTILARCVYTRQERNGVPIPHLLGTIQDITESQRKEKEFFRMNRALKALSMASRVMLEAVDEKRFMVGVCQLIVEHAGYRLAWVGMAQPDTAGSVLPVAQFGYEEGYLENLRISWKDTERGRGPTGTAIRTGRPSLARNILADPVYLPWRQQALARGYASSLALPLFLDQQTIGSLNIYAPEPDAFDEAEIGFLTDLASHVSLGIGALRQAMHAKRLMAAVEQVEEMVLISDRQGTIQYVNQALLRMTGFESTEVLGQNANMFRSGQTPQEVVDDLWNTLSQGKSWRGHFANQKKDGSIFRVLASVSPVKDPDGAIRHYVAVYRDVTRHEQIESQLRQSQKMEAIGTLAGGIAHDFNNILGVIIGYTELVLKKLTVEDQKYQDLQEVFSASLRARDLIAQLLAFSRQTDMQATSIALGPLVKETLRFLRAVIPANVKLVTHLTSRELSILGNPTQIHQILMNLCTNGVQALAQRSGAELTISLEDLRIDADKETLALPLGHYARITIQDNGCGIPKEIQSRIFDPFFTTKGVGEGTGLGLSVVHGHVADLGGAIQLESLSGSGTTFQIFLPLEKPAMERRKGRRDQEKHPPLPCRILVVDDEPQLVQVLTEHLTLLGCQCVSATSAREAIDLLRADPDRFDLVITDQTMPDATGDQLLMEVRALAPKLPVVLTSGYQELSSPQELHARGFLDFLPKPILTADLERLLNRLAS
ncbi:MAG: GAF domain-containing protein [Magnetococcales bacterium]|nr:GAF domain-containing protein [Magnetococcales bacterium]